MTTMNIAMQRYCPACNEDRDFHPETLVETIAVRGEQVTAEVRIVACGVCGDTQHDPEHDPMVAFYDEYRRRKGLLFADDIRRIRDKYRMSCETLAGLLGMSPASLYRYEGGGLQDEAHDELIRSCDDMRRMFDLVHRHREKLSDLQYRRFIVAVRELPVPLYTITWTEMFPVDDEYAGGRPFSYERFAFVVCTLCTIAGAVYTTKLNKLLFYTDFLAQKALGHAITGSPYRAVQHGPVPADYDTLLQRLEQDGLITREEIDFNDYSGVRIATGPSDVKMDVLPDADERAVIEYVANYFHHYTAKAIRDLSHSEAAYQHTPQKKLISYSHAAELTLDMPAGANQ